MPRAFAPTSLQGQCIFDPMVETRIVLRFRVSKAATIEIIGGRSINCVIRNLSIAGAAIPLSKCSGVSF